MPALGALSPAISRSAVDFPQPDGPSSETNSPLATSRSSGPERGHAVIIDLGNGAQTHGKARRIDIRLGQSGLGHPRQFFGRRSTPTPLLTKRNV